MSATNATRSLFLLFTLTVPAYATQYTLQAGYKGNWDDRNSSWFTAIVDTEADTLTLLEVYYFQMDYLPFPIGRPWQAVQPGPDNVPIPYDVPDLWWGQLNNWGFIPPRDIFPLGGGFFDMRPTENSFGIMQPERIRLPGIGCITVLGVDDEADTLICGNALRIDPSSRMYAPFIGVMSLWPMDGVRQVWGKGLGAGEIAVTPAIPEMRCDSNLDGIFDSNDIIFVFQQWMHFYESVSRVDQAMGADSSYQYGDWNGDLYFNSEDFVYAFQTGNYEREMTTAIPEPATWLLLLLGCVLAGRSIRR